MMMRRFLPYLFTLLLLHHAMGSCGFPVMRSEPLKKELMWELETELTGHRERNGAVMECTAAALVQLLQSSGREACVLSLIEVLTTPCEADTPESAIKELLMAGEGRILVSDDASFAVLHIPTRSGNTLEIIRDTATGLSVHRLQR